jgi:hypothetical protein
MILNSFAARFVALAVGQVFGAGLSAGFRYDVWLSWFLWYRERRWVSRLFLIIVVVAVVIIWVGVT